MSDAPQLVPELAVTNLAASLAFWIDLIGFEVAYSRPDEGFAQVRHDRAWLMLDQIDLGRTWRTGELHQPLGRGINLELSVRSLDPALQRLAGAAWPLFMQPEEKWYRIDGEETGVRQFLVQDPDGYLLRVQAALGRRPVQG